MISSRGVFGTRGAIVVGHLPPPVTGENLCADALQGALRELGFSVVRLGRLASLRHVSADADLWILPGASFFGTIRDACIARLYFRARRTFIYVHNRSWMRFAALPWLMPRRDATFVVLHEGIATKLRSRGLRATVLANTLVGLDEPAQERSAATPKRLLWMGALTAEKGLDFALQVFRILRESGWEFVVCGDGPLRGSVLNEKGVDFRGFVGSQVKSRLLAEGGVMILPTRYAHETQPLAILESMAFGVPFVSTEIGGIPQMAGGRRSTYARLLSLREGPSMWANSAMELQALGSTAAAAAQKSYSALHSRAAYLAGVRNLVLDGIPE